MKFFRKRNLKLFFTLQFLFFSLLLCNCSRGKLRVTRLPLLDFNSQNPVLRAEILRRSYGILSLQKREEKKGEYYVVRWRDEKISAERKLVFEYCQRGEESLSSQKFPLMKGKAEGIVEFFLPLEEIKKKGEVFCWRVSLFIDNEAKFSQSSMLWSKIQKYLN